MLNFSAFSQSLETLSIVISDQNGDLVEVAVVSLTYSNGHKAAEIDLSKAKKMPTINIDVGIYALEIQSQGFKTFKNNIEIKKGQIKIEVHLQLEEIIANINIERSERE